MSFDIGNTNSKKYLPREIIKLALKAEKNPWKTTPESARLETIASGGVGVLLTEGEDPIEVEIARGYLRAYNPLRG